MARQKREGEGEYNMIAPQDDDNNNKHGQQHHGSCLRGFGMAIVNCLRSIEKIIGEIDTICIWFGGFSHFADY